MGRNREGTPSIRWGLSRSEAREAGYRSTYEYAIALALEEAGVPFEYEAETYEICVPAGRSYRCPGCYPNSQVERVVQYTPDFFFNDRSFVIEAKGRFDPVHRAKALAFKQQYPDIEYAMLFEADNKLSKKRETRYTDWCIKHEILCGVGLVPTRWIKELT